MADRTLDCWQHGYDGTVDMKDQLVNLKQQMQPTKQDIYDQDKQRG